MSEIREALTAAMGEQETEATETTTEVVASEVKPEVTVEKPAAARGPDGKFAPKTAEAVAPTAEPKPEAPKPVTEAAPVVEVKPPQSWKPAIREKWASLPPDVREEVARREREMSVALSQSAEARRKAEQFDKVIAPYRSSFTGEPVAVVSNLLQTAHALNTGTPQSKAAMVAQIVAAYKVDIQALDAALAGQTQPERQQQEFRDPRLDRLLEQAEQQRRQQQTLAQQEDARKVAEFSAKHEFFEDLRDDMADIVEMRARNGVACPLEEAYALAVKMHPEISGVIAQREAAKAAATQNGATLRARNASSSVRNEAAPAVAAQPDDLRSSIIAAMAKTSGR